MNDLLFVLVPLLIICELYTDIRLRFIVKNIERNFPLVFAEIGYAPNDGAYLHGLKSNFKLPFSVNKNSLPVGMRWELRAFAGYRLISIGLAILIGYQLTNG